MPAHNNAAEDFLFSLNQAMSDTHTPQGNGPHDVTADANHNSSILAGLNAFTTSDDADSDSSANQGWHEQLALWTNASFSFDGPTGHALLLDEDKDDGGRGPDRGQGSSSRNSQNHTPTNNHNTNANDLAAQGHGNSGINPHDTDAAQSGADRHRPNGQANSAHLHAHDVTNGQAVESSSSAEPTHRDHKLQADHMQQNQYFAPPSSNATEGRRPGRSLPPRDERSRRHAENDPLPQDTAARRDDQPFSIGQNAFSAFSTGTPVASTAQQQQQQQQSTQPPSAFLANPPAGQMSPEFLQALAFQQILSGSQDYSQNPLALASFMSMGSFNPLFGGAAHAGAPGGLFPPQLTAPGAPAPFTLPAGLAPWSAPVDNRAPPSSHPSGMDRDRDEGKSAKSSHKKRRQSKAESDDESGGEDSAKGSADVGRAARDEIPPLQLIDTGNPDADAEANRLAIEEDKRRRNTAASARFRIKKKQREQALEQTTKELESRVRELEESNSTLERENGWLKSLIHVRHGHPLVFPHGLPVGASLPNAALQPSRDTGLQPRGVGTNNAARTFEDFQRNQPSATAAGKRSREE
ncbi:unnamed protein product [Parajaminaea phylloscopi]